MLTADRYVSTQQSTESSQSCVVLIGVGVVVVVVVV
jgi:hypothetical protein